MAFYKDLVLTSALMDGSHCNTSQFVHENSYHGQKREWTEKIDLDDLEMNYHFYNNFFLPKVSVQVKDTQVKKGIQWYNVST